MRRSYFSTFQLILLALFAGLIVVAKIAFRSPIQLPGHSGLFWMALLVVAAGVVPKRGAASLTGLTSGILASFLGLGDFGALDTLLSYTMAGVGVDLGLMLMQASPENLLVATLAGDPGPPGQVPGQVDLWLDLWRAAGFCRPGAGLVAGELYPVWRFRRSTGWADAQGAATGWLLCIYGREEIKPASSRHNYWRNAARARCCRVRVASMLLPKAAATSSCDHSSTKRSMITCC